ncbi:MAG: MarR family transcriptional regulator [Alphaproteobacteria bacterium]|nr:MarR family transcriptional regulator [Alphaproteobacteria bacterium]
MNDFIAGKGHAAFGTRLRRLSERLDRDVRELYRAQGLDFEPSWFPVFVALSEVGAMSVGELAAHMRITHAAVSQIRGRLLKDGLVRVRADSSDHRRQMLQLTERGEALIERLRPLWRAIAEVTEGLNRLHSPKLLEELSAFEAALDQRSLFARVSEIAVRSGQVRVRKLKGKSHGVR